MFAVGYFAALNYMPLLGSAPVDAGDASPAPAQREGAGEAEQQQA